jgi:hypothetical protein
LNRYLKENGQTERQNLLNGMSCARSSWLIDRFLDNLLNTSIIRSTDALSGFRNIAIRPDSIIKAWNFFRANWVEIYRRLSIY